MPIGYRKEVDANVQDQTTPPIDFFFVKIKGAPTTIAVATIIDGNTVTVTSASGCAMGDYFGMFNTASNRYYFATILSIATNTLTLDTLIDFEYQIGDTAACFNRNLNVDGSSTAQIYQVEVGSGATSSIDITKVLISFITDTAMDLSKFGDLAVLTNGFILRRINSDIRNIWNVKTNGELANLCFDFEIFQATNPAQGQDGGNFRYSLAGQDKHGVAIRLHPGDKLQLIIQDDLTDITQLRAIAEGHIVDP